MKEKVKLFGKKILSVLSVFVVILTLSFNISLAYTSNGNLAQSSRDSGSTNVIKGYNSLSSFYNENFGTQIALAQQSAGNNTVVSVSSCRPGQARNFKDLIINLIIGCILSPLVYLIIAASVIVFLLGILKFIRSEGDDKQAGREFVVWGIVGLFVMISVWGLVSILSSTFSLNNATLNLPVLK